MISVSIRMRSLGKNVLGRRSTRPVQEAPSAVAMSYFATHSRLGLKGESVNYRLFGLMGLLTAIFSGVYGFLMLGSWFVSDHLDLHHNLNFFDLLPIQIY